MADKNIKDYLHLYGIGCPITTPDGQGSLLVIYPRAIEVHLNTIQYQQEMKGRKGGGEMHYIYSYEECKPILRRLEDTTEEEMIDQEKIAKRFMPDFKIDEEIRKNALERLREKGVNAIEFNEENNPLMVFEFVRYYLSKSFDLFGLIDADLAIDAKTIQP